MEADYVTIPLDDVVLDAATANIKTGDQLAEMLQQLETQMREAAKKFEFEKAAQLRDRIRSLKQKDLAALVTSNRPRPPNKRLANERNARLAKSHRAALQLLQRIKCTAPDNAALPQRTPPSSAAACS